MLPSGLDLPSAENCAFALVRGLRSNPRSWSDLVAHAQLVMGYFQELRKDQTTQLYDVETSASLIAASRILDSVSLPESELPEAERQDWAVLAILAFGMWGNFLSSSALNARLSRPEEISPVTAAIIATCTPQLAHDFQKIVGKSQAATAYLGGLVRFLRTGSSEHAADLEKLLMGCLADADSFESAMLRSARIVVRHVIQLSAISVITPIFPNLGASYSKRLFTAGVRVLLPPQFNAIRNRRLPQSTENSLVALHTSAGKTLLGELCLLRSLDNGPGLAVYLAPYVALGRQVAEGVRRRCPDAVRVHMLIGGFRAEDSLDPQIRRELVVATPERFDAIIRKSRALLSHLRCIVVDEAHLIGSGIRGIRLEGILARLRMSQKRDCNFRIILLSAVTNSYSRLQHWLDIPDDCVVKDEWRPTARRLAIWDRDGYIRWFRGPELVRNAGSRNTDVIGAKLVPWPNVNFYAAKHFGSIRTQEPKAIENVAVLAEYLWTEFRDVCLCVCMSKHTTRQLAWRLAMRFQPLQPLPPQLQKTVDIITQSYPHLHLLAFCCRRGVAYHNASLPHEVRIGIEEAANNRELRTVTATTTLAEGVDLPFRTTVIVDWLSWQGNKSGPMSPLLFRNIAGRCGRAGRQTEGDTVIFDNPVGDAGFTFDPNRGDLIKRLFVDDVKLEIESVFESAKAGTDFADDLSDTIASQFLAAIPENPEENDLVQAFSDALYWNTGNVSESKAQKLLRDVAKSILDNSERSLAVAASPFKLTTFGTAAVTSGLSPTSCRAIMRFFACDAPSNERSEAVGKMLVELGRLPEQPNRHWRKEVQKPGKTCRVKKADAAAVVDGWFKGGPLLKLFTNLPSVRKSKSKVAVTDWLAGLDEPATWDEEFDAFVDWVNGVIVSFASWVTRSCSDLSNEADGWASSVNWLQLSEFCELGVDSDWAVKALREGAPAGREILSPLGRSIFQPMATTDDPLALEKLGIALASDLERTKLLQRIEALFQDNVANLASAMAVVERLSGLPQ